MATGSTKWSFAKRWQAIVLSAVLAASGFVAISATVSPVAEQAQAASGADFNPGNIMSDSVFYDSRTMTVSQIQSFLNSKVPNCRSGYTCLKDYRQNTAAQSAKSAGCSAYAGGANLSAAQIIANVASVCGINPQVLLVLLEKEQGLVSDDWPSDRQYRSATGYGCPDTADCDTQYYGFFNQLYNAAWQFKKYQASPEGRGYQAGRTNTIHWHPNAGCGTSQVYIENQATAGLYLYTPYRPNQAALNNMYGTGDGCSSYGNRNFFRMFTDWFGSTIGAASYFARTADNPSLFLISGAIKYPVPSMEVYYGLSALGTFKVVSQSYLNGFSTSSKWASLVVRDPLSGAVFLTQGKVKSQFPSCAMVVNYGYTCGEAIDLTTSQLSRWSTSALVSAFFVVAGSGDVYYLAAGGRYHVYEWSTVVLLNGGKSPFVATMRSDIAAGYPIIRTLLRPQALVKSSTSSDVFFIDGLDKKVHISSFALAAEYGATGYSTMPQAILDGYPTAPGVLSIVSKCASGLQIASAGKLLPWTGNDGSGLAITELSADSCERIPRGKALQGKLFVKSPGSVSVYGVENGSLVSFSTWGELLASNGGVSPQIVPLSSGTIATIPKAPALPAGAVVRSPSDPMIYFIDGAAQKIPVSSFTTMAELGKSGWSTVGEQDLSSYPRANGFVSRVVSCNGSTYFGAGGTLYATTANTGIATTTLTPATCSGLSISAASALTKVFVKTSDSTTVYYIDGGVRKPVASWDRLLELNGGVSPTILRTGQGGLNDLQLGGAA